MHMEIIYEGQTYSSPDDGEGEKNVKKVSEDFYKIAAGIEKFQMPLNNVGVLILPKGAIQRSVMFFIP